ncbi:MAG: tyrosine-type recombinase/integrase [Planctomycetes bacterium]|jgi:integrase|nr:tyrosine-type recombinase/integrase [Planctomycetota bacterium]
MDANTLTLQQLFDYFDAAALVEGATKKRCARAAKTLIGCLGNIPAASLEPLALGRWQLWCRAERGMAAATVRSGFGSVSQVYTWGVRMGLVPVNPLLTAEKIRVEHREPVIFAPDERAALSAAAATLQREDPSAQLRWCGLLLLTGESALRIGEALNLRWEDMDLDRERLHVRYRPDCPGQFWAWGTKGKTDRVAPMSDDLVACVYRLREIAGWRYPWLKQVACLRLQGLVGTIPEAVRKMPYWNLYREFEQVRQRANQDRPADRQIQKDGRFHQLRRSAISGWVDAGVSLVDAQNVAGHRSLETTRRFYTTVALERSCDRVRPALVR